MLISFVLALFALVFVFTMIAHLTLAIWGAVSVMLIWSSYKLHRDFTGEGPKVVSRVCGLLGIAGFLGSYLMSLRWDGVL